VRCRRLAVRHVEVSRFVRGMGREVQLQAFEQFHAPGKRAGHRERIARKTRFGPRLRIASAQPLLEDIAGRGDEPHRVGVRGVLRGGGGQLGGFGRLELVVGRARRGQIPAHHRLGVVHDADAGFMCIEAIGSLLTQRRKVAQRPR